MKFFKSVSVIIFLLVITQLTAQDYYMSSPVGFGRNATGGGNATPVVVSTYSELESALNSSGSSVIIVSGTINFGGVGTEMINKVITNKTLLGLPGAKLITDRQDVNGGILGLKKGSGNVIIRNLIFEGPGAYDVDGKDLLQNTGCTDLWVDHCEFYDGVDGNYDNTQFADNITISWCKFGYNQPPKAGGSGGSNDHRFTNLVGGSASDAPADNHYSITFQYCYWSEGCRDRMPRARNAELHILNCYYYSSVGNCAIGLGGGKYNLTCFVEGCNFEKVSKIYSSYNSTDGGSHSINFNDCLPANKIPGNVGLVSKPTYSYTAIDVDEVKNVVTSACGAGATLLVDTDGNISSPCSGTSINFNNVTDPKEVADIKYYTLTGMKIDRLGKGNVVIVKTLYADGSVEASKVIVD